MTRACSWGRGFSAFAPAFVVYYGSDGGHGLNDERWCVMNPLLGVFLRAFGPRLGWGRFLSRNEKVLFMAQGSPQAWLIATIHPTSACNPQPSSHGLAWLLAWALNEMSVGRGPACEVPGGVTVADVGREVLYSSRGGDAVEIGKVVDVGVVTRVAFVDFGHGEEQQIKACSLEDVMLIGGSQVEAKEFGAAGDKSGGTGGAASGE